MNSQRNLSFVKQVDQTLKLLLMLKLKRNKNLDAIESNKREWLVSLMKKLDLDLMTRTKMTFKNKLTKTTLKKTKKDLMTISMDSLSKLTTRSSAIMMKKHT